MKVFRQRKLLKFESWHSFFKNQLVHLLSTYVRKSPGLNKRLNKPSYQIVRILCSKKSKQQHIRK